VNHSRWLTLAVKVLVLYTRTVEPPSVLVSLATFVQQVYGPMWFQIKSRPSFTSGAVHLFSSMQLIKTQPDDVQKVTKEVVQRNAYFAHSENVLAAMVTDGDGEGRGRAVDVILTARGQSHHPLRRFSVPQLNWEADAYPEMINWEGPMTEPP